MNDYNDLDSLTNETPSEEEEVVLEKDKSRALKIKRDWRKAISRFNLIKNIKKHKTEHPVGYYRNNNEANANTDKTKKTNTRKSSANYRHSGGYGSANKYSPKDRRRLDDMQEDLGD